MSSTKPHFRKSRFDRKYSPVEAAYAVVQFLPAYPALWLEQCGLAGKRPSEGYSPDEFQRRWIMRLLCRS